VRIAVVCPFSASFAGGVLQHARDQVESLAEGGHDVRLLVPHDPPDALTRLLHRRADADGPAPYAEVLGRSLPLRANRSTARVTLSPRAAVRVRRALRAGDFDVVHVHDPLAPVASAAALAFARAPVVATCHAGGSPLYALGRRALRPLIGRIDRRIAVSQEAARAAEPALGGPFEIVPNGVRLPRTADPGGRAPHVLFLGRAEPRKGLSVLLRAWPAIRRGTGARLRLAGVEAAAARRILQRLGVDGEGVDLLGVVHRSRRDAELASARLLVAPSLGRESFGLVLCEAFARATPVVASRIGGYEEVVRPGTGLLVPPGDADGLASAVVDLLGDERRRAAFGAAARREAEERYDWRRVTARLEGIYTELVDGR
jgi:phosphatidyl-myo-inositol alpha-mannosyltransferase